LITTIAVFIKGPEEKEVLNKFYYRVRPSEFWEPVAQEFNKTQSSTLNRFFEAIFQMALCALTCFELLVGMGTLLVGGTPPVWFPNSTLWSIFCVALALGVAPVLWKSLRNKN
jgi:hypothetical protein